MARIGKDEFRRMIVEAAKRINEATGFPWQLIAAQACLESAYGQRVPVDLRDGRYSFNIFGHKDPSKTGVLTYTSEYVTPEKAQRLAAAGLAEITGQVKNGLVRIRVKAWFKAYSSFDHSIMDYINLMRKPRYRRVWQHKDPVMAARAVQACGYATDPDYAKKLIDLMKREGWIQ